ncbi:MAG: helix-turn-helix domain-containing protein [Enhygromyxa sp.]
MAASDHPNQVAIEVLTADEVAGLLRVNRKTVYEAAQRGDIPHRRLGRRLVFEQVYCASLAAPRNRHRWR